MNTQKFIEYNNFKVLGKQKKKHQIILSNTFRKIDDYLISLINRHNGKYNKIPNYIIDREGKIHKLLNDIEHTEFFLEPNINRNSIIITLENLGWLEKEPLNNQYVNWIGDIYKGEVYEKKWRDYFFWQPYTTNQIKSLSDLCINLANEIKIPRRCIGHNTKIDGIDRYEGIVSRSNFLTIHTDLNPSFNFETFEKFLENEQLTQREI